MKPITVVDLFAGAGGTSTGVALACEEVGRRLDLTAVNHWPTAVETHAANHPEARHVCETLDAVDPRKLHAPGKVDLLVASPECTHHSNARGGKPVSDQSRATAWHVVRWADALQPRSILVENVREFRTWGPVGVNGRPLRSRQGETFQAWLQALRSLGYRVSHRVLCAADYGDPTTRERLFVIASRGRAPLEWPEPTHRGDGDADLFGQLPRWRAAREVIDWSIRGQSIFTRKRPLSPNTLARIEAGLRRFAGDAFTLHTTHRGGDRVNATHDPLPTVTGANRGEQALVEPFTVSLRGTGTDQLPYCNRGVGEPVPTVSAGGNHLGLVEPFIVPTNYGERPGQSPRTHSIDAPLPTVVGTVAHGFVVTYYGTGGPRSVDEPLDTVTAQDRFALIEVCRRSGVDILFRMLQPHELAAAHSFPAGYVFKGNRGEQVKQVGNSVPVRLARALARSRLDAA